MMKPLSRTLVVLSMVSLLGPLSANANISKAAEAATKTLFADATASRNTINLMERLGLFTGPKITTRELNALKLTSRPEGARAVLLELATKDKNILRFLEAAHASGATGTVLTASQLSAVMKTAEQAALDSMSRSAVEKIVGSTPIIDTKASEEKAIVQELKNARYEGRQEPFLNIYDVLGPKPVGERTDPRILIDIINKQQGSNVPAATNYPRVDYSADGRLVLLIDHELINNNYIRKGRVTVMDTSTHELVYSFPFDYELQGSLIRWAVFSENFKTAVFRTENDNQVLIDFSSGQPTEITTFYANEEIVLSPNGEFVVVKMSNGTQSLYRLRDGVLSRILTENRPSLRGSSVNGSRMNDEVFSADGSVVILQTGLSTATAYKIDPVKNTYDVMAVFPIMRTYMKLITPDGRFLLLGRGNKIIVRDLETHGDIRNTFKLKNYTNLSDVNNMRTTLAYYSKDSKTIGLSVPTQLDVASMVLDGYLIGLDRAGEDFIQHIK